MVQGSIQALSFHTVIIYGIYVVQAKQTILHGKTIISQKDGNQHKDVNVILSPNDQ